MAVLEIHKFKYEDYRLLIKFNDKIEFVSKSFNSRVDCLRIICFIRKASHLDKTYDVKRLNCGSWCFEFKSSDKKSVLGRSETYLNESTVLEKIAQMKMYTPKAKFKRNSNVSNAIPFDNLLKE